MRKFPTFTWLVHFHVRGQSCVSQPQYSTLKHQQHHQQILQQQQRHHQQAQYHQQADITLHQRRLQYNQLSYEKQHQQFNSMNKENNSFQLFANQSIIPQEPEVCLWFFCLFMIILKKLAEKVFQEKKILTLWCNTNKFHVQLLHCL